jgi:hypothetical protein
VKTESHETRKKFEKKEKKKKTNYLLPRMRRKRRRKKKKTREKNGLSGNKNWQLHPDGNLHRPDGKFF